MTITELMAQFANPETLKTLSFTHKLLAGLVTTLLGMGITFIALIILQMLISWMDKLINRSSVPAQKISPATVAPHKTDSVEQKDDNELVAVITTVIAMQMNTAADNIVIRNIKKIEDRSPLWNRAGIIELMNNRL
jgi:sodium pump decarboxylase gamma subunit